MVINRVKMDRMGVTIEGLTIVFFDVDHLRDRKSLGARFVSREKGVKKWEKIGVPSIYIHEGDFREIFGRLKKRQEAMITRMIEGSLNILFTPTHLILDDEDGSIAMKLGLFPENDKQKEELVRLQITVHDCRFEKISKVIEPPTVMRYAKTVTKVWAD